MKQRDVIKMLEQNGFNLKRSGKHMIFSNGVVSVAVPHQKEIKSWTVNQIKKHMGMYQKEAV